MSEVIDYGGVSSDVADGTEEWLEGQGELDTESLDSQETGGPGRTGDM